MLDSDDLLEEFPEKTPLSLKSMKFLKAADEEVHQEASPEQRLLVAMMRRAINDLALERERNHAYEYIFEDPEDAVLSFNSCCELLGWAPKEVKASIRRRFKEYCQNTFSV